MVVHGVDLTPVAQLSALTLRSHGPNAAGAGWRDEASQRLRFAQLVRSLRIEPGQPITVNDLGCGWGALYSFLGDAGYQVEGYRGHDICPAMLEAGRQLLGRPAAEFVPSGQIVAPADYAFASGIFNIRIGSTAEWKRYARDVLADMAGQSARGFAFNMLTTHNTYAEDRFFYGDPAEWLDWCLRELSPDAQLLHDYPAYEWTIGARTDGERPRRRA
jgi:hypothetical protein